MHSSTAVLILRELAKRELLTTVMTTFSVPRFPQLVHVHDIKEAFIAIADAAGQGPSSLEFSYATGIDVYCKEKLFDKIFKAVFVTEKLFPKHRNDINEGPAPLPTLFIGSEKTQVRQIPLTETRPWPFKFLLELGGMIVCNPVDKRDFILELKQYLNNHPQYSIKVDAKEWPDGKIAVFTYWFSVLPKKQRKANVNVPSRASEFPPPPGEESRIRRRVAELLARNQDASDRD
jgi:hypothetical protein